MAERITVVDPASGAVLTVAAGSVQARLWGVADAAPAVADGAREGEQMPDPKVEPVKRKPGRPKKS